MRTNSLMQQDDNGAWNQLCAINPPKGVEYTQCVLKQAQIINRDPEDRTEDLDEYQFFM